MDASFAKNRVLNIFERIGDSICMIAAVIRSLVRKAPDPALIREQFYSMGVLSLGVVAITGLTTGIVLAAQSFYQLGEKGLSGVTGVLVAKAMITELGPILTAFMITGRVGSAMCAEIGSMKISEQIDALKSMNVHPINYLIAPRFLAGIIMIPLLTFFSAVMGILGGYIISALFFNMPSGNYFHPIPLHMSAFDLAVCFIKSTIFGALIITVCCHRGLNTTGGAAGVGKATTQSVVTSYILILICDLLLTMSLNMMYKQFKMEWIFR